LSRRGVFGGRAEELTRLAVYERSEQAIEAEKALATPPLLRLCLGAIAGTLLLLAEAGAVWAWLGAAAFMLAVCGARAPMGAAAGAIAAAVACFRVFAPYDGQGIFWLILMLNAAGGAIAGALAALVSERLPAQAFAFLAALLPAGLEHLGGLGPTGPLGSTALTQYTHPMIVCMGRLAGLAGVTYVIFLFGGAAASAVRYLRKPAVALAAAGPALAVAAIGLLYGAASSANSGKSIEAMAANFNSQHDARRQLVAQAEYEADAWMSYMKSMNETAGRLARKQVVATAIERNEGQRTVQLVVCPEAAVVVDAEAKDVFLKQIEAIARNSGCAIAAGIYDLTTTESVAVLTGPEGEAATGYARRDFVAGVDNAFVSWQIAARGAERPGAFDTPFGRAAVVLSLDANDFGNFKAAARDGAKVMCVCGYDEATVPRASIRLLVYNAALSGLAVVKSATAGTLAVIDADGRILASEKAKEKTDSQLEALVPLGEGKTVFLAVGNAFAWLALLGGIAAGLGASSLRAPGTTGPGHARPSGKLSYKTKEGLKDI